MTLLARAGVGFITDLVNSGTLLVGIAKLLRGVLVLAGVVGFLAGIGFGGIHPTKYWVGITTLWHHVRELLFDGG